MGDNMTKEYEEEVVTLLQNRCLNSKLKPIKCPMCNEYDARSGKNFINATFNDCCYGCNYIAYKYNVKCKAGLYKYLIIEEEKRLERAIEGKYWNCDWAEDIYDKIMRLERKMEDV